MTSSTIVLVHVCVCVCVLETRVCVRVCVRVRVRVCVCVLRATCTCIGWCAYELRAFRRVPFIGTRDTCLCVRILCAWICTHVCMHACLKMRVPQTGQESEGGAVGGRAKGGRGGGGDVVCMRSMREHVYPSCHATSNASHARAACARVHIRMRARAPAQI
jgi:hypothetical protein